MGYRILVPARDASTRLPGKALREVGGRALLEHVHASARASHADAVIVATDDPRIRAAAESFGAGGVMTSGDHRSGTERLAEAVQRLQLPPETVIVNLQGDEFGMPPELLDQVADLLAGEPQAAMATLCEPIEEAAERDDPNIVKVVFDSSGWALYFSRAPIPWRGGAAADGELYGYRHIGLYAYRAGYLIEYARLPVSPLEEQERLEQLRALESGARIRIAPACRRPGFGIDTPADLERARRKSAEC